MNYTEYLTVAIKSICFHNRNIQFYLLNKEIPSEFFAYLNRWLVFFDSQITDVKIHDEILKKERSKESNLTETTYYRLLIPALFAHLDKVLYLDCDVVVEGSLDDLYQTNVDKYLFAAAKDIALNCGEHWYAQFPPDMKPYFNAGVLLFNCQKCLEFNLVEKSLAIQHYQFLFDDQDILNILARHRWLELDYRYNFQPVWREAVLKRIELFQEKLNRELVVDFNEIEQQQPQEPVIIHYISAHKPWWINQIPKRDRYWFYHNLEWADIFAKHMQSQS